MLWRLVLWLVMDCLRAHPVGAALVDLVAPVLTLGLGMLVSVSVVPRGAPGGAVAASLPSVTIKSLSTLRTAHWPQPIFSKTTLLPISGCSMADIINRLCLDNESESKLGTSNESWLVIWRIGRGPFRIRRLARRAGVILDATWIPSGDDVERSFFLSSEGDIW